MEIQINRIGKRFVVLVNGLALDGVVDYRVSSSAKGETRLALEISIESEATEFVMSIKT